MSWLYNLAWDGQFGLAVFNMLLVGAMIHFTFSLSAVSVSWNVTFRLWTCNMVQKHTFGATYFTIRCVRFYCSLQLVPYLGQFIILDLYFDIYSHPYSYIFMFLWCFPFLSSHDTIHLYTFPVLTAILVYFVNHCTGLQFERLNWTGSPPNPAHLTSPPHVQTIWQVPVPRPSSSFRHSGKAITC